MQSMKLSNVFEKIKFTQDFCETMIDSTRKKKEIFTILFFYKTLI